MSSLRFTGRLNLSQRRQEFANQIRRAQRREIIHTKRKILYQQYLNAQNNLQQQTSQSSTLPLIQLLNILKPNTPNEQQILLQLATRLSSKNGNILYTISQVVSSGKCSYLLENLNTKRYLRLTLSIISQIVSKPNYRHAQMLVEKGIIQMLLEILVQEEYTAMVACIIGNICIQSDDYSEMILQNFKHQHIIDVFNKLYERFVKNECEFNPQKQLKTLLWLLSILIATKQSTLDFCKQYDRILYFCKDLMQRRVFVNDAIGTVFQLAIKNPSRVEQVLSPVINSLLQQQTGQNQHLQNMLQLIIKLTPAHINYNKIFSLVFYSQYKIIKTIIYIINKIEDNECLTQLVKNQAWWERVLIKLDSNSQQFKMTLSIIRRLKISFPCVWRFISEYMEDTYSKDVVLEIIIFLKNEITDAFQAKTQKTITLLQTLNKYKITKSLQNLFHKEKFQYESKVQQLIDLIQNLSKDIKNQYQIDIQI